MRPGDAGGDNTRDFTVPPVLRMHTRFVLIQTSHAGNVGGVARAMKVMGFDDLVLVQPRWANVLRREETIQRASGANDVLAKARIVDTLDEALDGMSHLCATAMTPRDFGPPTRAPREHFAAVLGEQEPPQGVAFLFGSERFGMRNEDVYRCHVALSIPTAPGFGSLNLAAAVQVISYELRMQWLQAGDIATVSNSWDVPLATSSEIEQLFLHLQKLLLELDFYDPDNPRQLLTRLRRLLLRSGLDRMEVNILRGILAAAMARIDH